MPEKLLPKSVALLEQGLRERTHLGFQIYVSMRREVVLDLAMGESRQGVPMESDTINPWFSSGKPLTALAVAQLWEMGLLDLDAPVCRFIPEFGEFRKEGITVRHLLTHTAGFLAADRLPTQLAWDEMLAQICATPLEPAWFPGRKAGYQLFSSWHILGELVGRLGRKPIEEWIHYHVLQVLNSKDCSLSLSVESQQRLGTKVGLMHSVTQSGLRPHPVWNDELVVSRVKPGGSMRGPIRELGRFYESLLGFAAAPVIPSSVAEFTRRHRVGMFDETFRHVLDWGLGFAVNSNRYGAESVPYGFGRHASENAFGHGGSQSSMGFADPEHGLAVAWVCNGMPGEAVHQKRARDLNSAIYEDLGLA